MTWRNLELAPGRFERWWDRFHTEHPGVELHIEDAHVILTSSDGTIAKFRGWYPPTSLPHAQRDLLAAPQTVGILLLRRGGYAVARVATTDGGRLLEHKTGTRYVQGRTAAGGWSQQRFARRRQNQADELVTACATHADRILTPLNRADPAGVGLALGGDERLLAELLADPRLSFLQRLPHRTYPNIPDPRFKTLEDIASRLRSVEVRVFNP